MHRHSEIGTNGGRRSAPVAYDHLLAVIATQSAIHEGTVRLLDAGCGEGGFLDHVLTQFALLRPNLSLECHGFDVDDSGMMGDGLQERLVGGLQRAHHHVDWNERITVISSSDGWPYPDDFFDIIVSNQVLEHVTDHDLFFKESHRTLKDGGYAVHLAPLRHCLYEPHIHLPLFHHLNNHDLRVSYVRAATRWGLKNQFERAADTRTSVAEFSERESDVMREFTNYLSVRELYQLGKRNHLRTSLRYTQEYYRAKLRKMGGRPAVRRYDQRGNVAVTWLLASLLKYVASVTVFQEKKRVTSMPPLVADRYVRPPGRDGR
jgi:SAM-dependent methyltransferase